MGGRVELKPNMYRVKYKVMEGNNYAGGWGERISDIDKLSDVRKFNNIISIKPIFIYEFDDDVPQNEIDNAIDEFIEEQERAELEREIERAKKRLYKAERALIRR